MSFAQVAARHQAAAVAEARGAPGALPSALAEAADEPGLRLAVLPHAANIRLATDGGDLALHLRLRGGVANLTVGGSAGSVVEARASDLRAALAGQGIVLGRVDRVAAGAAGPADAAGLRGRGRTAAADPDAGESSAAEQASLEDGAAIDPLARGVH